MSRKPNKSRTEVLTLSVLDDAKFLKAFHKELEQGVGEFGFGRSVFVTGKMLSGYFRFQDRSLAISHTFKRRTIVVSRIEVVEEFWGCGVYASLLQFLETVGWSAIMIESDLLNNPKMYESRGYVRQAHVLDNWFKLLNDVPAPPSRVMQYASIKPE